MLLLALTSLRAAPLHADLAQLVLDGDLPGALRRAGERIERLPAEAAPQRAALGQLLGRALLACGREEEAEELFQRQLKSYEALSRHMVRWYGSMDQAAMLLHLNRPARALECSGAVADDARAPVEARIEAMAATAVAMHRAGDWRSAMKSNWAVTYCSMIGDEVGRRGAHAGRHAGRWALRAAGGVPGPGAVGPAP